MLQVTRATSDKIADPVEHFSTWYFSIPSHFFEILGVTHRQFVKNKIPYYSWATTNPPVYQFESGYIFYAKHSNAEYLQIASDWDAFKIEVHHKTLTTHYIAYALSENDLRLWLETGTVPASAIQLDPSQSKSGLLSWRLRHTESNSTQID